MPEERTNEDLFDEGYQEYAGEELQDEIPQEENIEEQEQTTDATEETTDTEYVEVEYYDDNGELVQEKLTQEEFNEAIKFYKKGAYNTDEQNDIAQKVQPYLDRYKQSKTLQYVDFLLSSGLDDRTILAMMYKDLKEKGYDQTLNDENKTNQESTETPYFDNIEDGVKYYVEKIKNEIIKELEPVKNELNQIKSKSIIQENIKNNEYVLTNALKKHGWDPNRLSKEQLKKIVDTFNIINPGADLVRTPLNQPQANILVKEALGYRNNKPNPQAAIKAQQKAIKTMPGTQSAQVSNPVELPSIITAKQAKSNLNKLFK